MKKLFYRIYQGFMYLAAFFLRWREPHKLQGDNAMDSLPEYLKSKDVDNLLVVTDKGLMSFHLLDNMFDVLTKSNIKFTVYDKTVPNPTIDNIEEAYGLYKENGCKGLIAFGGGSSMDCAKGVGIRVARPKKPFAKMRGYLKVGRKLPLLIAVPTTSGTGSETTLAAVITDGATHFKYAINDPVLIPDCAVLDSTLTLKLPPHITSTTGMDALCHAVEAYIGRANTKNTRANALKATKLIYENLYTAYCQPSNIEARANMQQASYLAGLAFTRAYVGYVHAIAHSLGGQYQIAHGLANAVILPHVLRAFGSSVYKQLSQLADAAGVSKQGQSVEEKAKAFIESIEELNKKMNIPTSFEQIKEADIPIMSAHADAEGNPGYPVPKILSKSELAALYYEIMSKPTSDTN